MFIWLFCLLLCDVLTLSSLQITLALCLLLNFCTVEYLVLHEIFLHAWAADYFPPHHILFLSAVSYYNKLYKSKDHPITYYLSLAFCKKEFCFYLENSGLAKTWPTQPSAMALVEIKIRNLSVIFYEHRFYRFWLLSHQKCTGTLANQNEFWLAKRSNWSENGQWLTVISSTVIQAKVLPPTMN